MEGWGKLKQYASQPVEQQVTSNSAFLTSLQLFITLSTSSFIQPPPFLTTPQLCLTKIISSWLSPFVSLNELFFCSCLGVFSFWKFTLKHSNHLITMADSGSRYRVQLVWKDFLDFSVMNFKFWNYLPFDWYWKRIHIAP